MGRRRKYDTSEPKDRTRLIEPVHIPVASFGRCQNKYCTSFITDLGDGLCVKCWDRKNYKFEDEEKMMDSQLHKLKDGSTVDIERKKSGRGHRYLLNGTYPVKSVTGILGHLDSDSFSIGMYWALKQARLAGGDLDAPKKIGAQAREAGELLHSQIEEFIKNGTIVELSPFLAWHSLMDNIMFSEGLSLVASERFLYDKILRIGGTLDCIAQTVEGDYHLYDWKTKDPESFDKYGPSVKDFTQAAGYVQALRNMNSAWQPTQAWIVYVMRDGSKAVRVSVPLKKYIPIYLATRKLASLLKEGNK